MESNEQYLTLEELKNIMSDYPLQYIVCGELAVDLFLLYAYTHSKINLQQVLHKQYIAKDSQT